MIRLSERFKMLRPLFAAALSALVAVTAARAGELKITDITKGTGEQADVGETVVVHYTGWLMDGTKFDSSHDRNQPFSFTLGERRVIPGWEQGVEGMKVGGKRELIIPPELGYGARGAGSVIPPNATLKFEVELLEVKGKKYSDLGNEELKAKLAAGVPVIDIRRPDEWKATGVLPGSHLITFFNDKGQINPLFGQELKKVISGPADEVIFICRSGNRSSVLSKHLAEKSGFTQIGNVQDGINGWIKAGGEVTDATLPDNCWLC
jgi:rhodanese-related sulfurtransferase